jgi:serine/threonine protein kinase
MVETEQCGVGRQDTTTCFLSLDDSTVRDEPTREASQREVESQWSLSSWKHGDIVGSGSYGLVRMAQDPATGHLCVVKVARMRQGRDSTFKEELQRELDITKDLCHPHVVKCLGQSFEQGVFEIYFEYVPGGSLRRHVEQFGPLNGHLLWKATRGMTSGLDYLHTHEPPIVHRDLKGANVLVDLSFCVKLADFGCSRRDSGTKSFSTIGSVHWMAPEVITASRRKQGHGRKADIWSLGCVAIEISTAADPWGKDAFDNIIVAMARIGNGTGTPPLPETLDIVGRGFVSDCLQRQPDLRPGASELLQHEVLCGGASISPPSPTPQ